MFWRSFLLGGGWGGKLAYFAVLSDLVARSESGGVWAGGWVNAAVPTRGLCACVCVCTARGYNKEEKRSTNAHDGQMKDVDDVIRGGT